MSEITNQLKKLALFLLFAVEVAYGQARLPGFQDYPVKEHYRGIPAPVRLDSKDAKMFRTVLRRGAKKGPNFAGHYTIVEWGSGSFCVKFAVVDAKTGQTYFPDFPIYYVDYEPNEKEAGIVKRYTPEYRIASRLLVTQGSFKGKGLSFYKWEKNRFVLIRSVGEDETEAR